MINIITYFYKYGLSGLFGRLIHGKGYLPTGIGLFRSLIERVWCVGNPGPIFSQISRRIACLVKSAGSIDIVLTHGWGGGSEVYIYSLVHKVPNDKLVFVVKPAGFKGALKVSTYLTGILQYNFIVTGLSAFKGLQGKTVRLICNELVYWQVFYGELQPSTNSLRRLIENIFEVRAYLNSKMIFLLHDYYSICPRIFLLKPNWKYCRTEVSAFDCKKCIGDEYQIDIYEWRKQFYRLLKACDGVCAFSEDTQRRIESVYAELDVTLVPHNCPNNFERSPTFNEVGLVIGVFGNIYPPKGANVVNKLARYLRENAIEDVKIIVVGEAFAPDDSSPEPSIKITGQYTLADLPIIIENEGINVAFFSSVCPETFSFVTQELIYLNLPIACFNFGAPRDRIDAYKKGVIIHDYSPKSILEALHIAKEKQ